jgi:hypothetical protein
MNEYIVHWRHGPAPGLTYYEGHKRVQAEDILDAGVACKQRLKAEACFEPSCITITAVEFAAGSNA